VSQARGYARARFRDGDVLRDWLTDRVLPPPPLLQGGAVPDETLPERRLRVHFIYQLSAYVSTAPSTRVWRLNDYDVQD
jgi:hypothetical protein